MVRKPNPSYYPEQQQQSNMQYPPSGGPPQDGPNAPYYGEGNQVPQRAEYPPQGQQYSSPGQSRPYGAPAGENQEYYQAPYQSQYQNQNGPYGAPEYPPYNQQSYPPQYQAQNPNPYNYNSPPPNAAYSPPAQSTAPYGAPMGELPTGHPPPLIAPQSDEERGLMGALAGGAAGGYAGHKMHHGFLGAMGGAYAGHKLEDAYKDHHNKPKPASPPPPQAAQQIPQSAPVSQLGNFSASSHNVTLDGDYDLIAECTACNGQKKLSSISLNAVLTNDDGQFKWVSHGNGNFGASARNVKLVEGGRVLEAELCSCNGQWRTSRIVLDEKIENDDGDLKLV